MKELHLLLSEKKETLQRLQKKLIILGWFRVVVFLAITYFLLQYFIFESGLKIHLYLAICSTVVFFILGYFLLNVKQELQFYKNYLHIGEEIINKTEFETGLDFEENIDQHSFAKDLDILGKNSLFSFINYGESTLGKNKLRDFLLDLSVEKEEIILRQKSIAELSEKTAWNIHFLTLAKSMEIKGKISHPTKSNSVFKNAVLAKIATIAVPVLTLATLLLAILLPISGALIGLLFAGILIISRSVLYVYRREMQKLGALISFDSNQYEQFLNVFSHIEKENFKEEINQSLQNKLRSGKSKSSRKEIEKLARLLRNYESGQSNIGVILNNFFLWNLNFTIKIEKQFNAIDEDLPQWFEAFAEFEAFISLGIFKFKNPDFILPKINEDGVKLKTEELIHPLLFQTNVVSNNFTINQSTEISIITGANMTGKSTFLRTVGINLVLAMTGCPVAAKEFSFIPMKLFTSMSTSDSLSEGTSYFNAEILRLRKLVENLENGEPQFIILDEILKGTNSQDKLTGSELFLEKLMKSNVLFSCLIATHDLDLTKIEEKFPLKIKNYCFELQNIDGELETDYKLQNGVTKSMNAIYLMRKFKIID
ncbi:MULTISPECIES: DNA mismatch repair protein MutS [unclassified Kaistella]|uniref:MutS-related protein n=1 Tax=unclassified Kaistella TaxID=2762626 RepID=UPI0027351CDA|nr:MULTISPECIES: DNA mismatch repair protein MutS [unclassified Kaistella]MDP2452965.1 DNA mismatch repair protein MutS [Kaistella sp. SH11-4b]MDP2455874.1 DNA mismatch repair protein MutS [Kaistella sp. SH40-3]MDP2458778.1 DNA mismatch repair protein MutS [Kaistella sp. SH19-2b]